MTSSPAFEPPTIDDVHAAAARLDGVAYRTPLIESPLLNQALSGRVLVKAEALEFPSETLRLSVFDQGRFIGSADSAGQAGTLPEDFPYGFRLVAYQNPLLKRVWVDLALSRESEVLAEGPSEVNNPLTWKRLRFFNTQTDADEFGLPYAGIQITDDPGRPFVFVGFGVLSLGGLLFFLSGFQGGRAHGRLGRIRRGGGHLS